MNCVQSITIKRVFFLMFAITTVLCVVFKTEIVAEYRYQKGLQDDEIFNFEGAREHYENAAREGHKRALIALIKLYDLKGVFYHERKSLRALEFFEQHAKSGDIDTMYFLGNVYKSVAWKGNADDIQKTYYWLKAASDNGHVQASLELALFALKQDFQYINEQAAKHLLIKAAKNDEKAKDYLFLWSDLIKAEGKDAKAMMRIADAFREGVNVQQDENAASQWYLKAYNSGEFESAYFVALYAYNEIGYIKSFNAIEYAEIAADKGDLRAVHLLAKMYNRGHGVEEDKELAKQYYLSAARAGHTESQIEMAEIYSYAKGANYQPEKAAYWWRILIKKGHDDAFYELISMHLDDEIKLTQEEKETALPKIIQLAKKDEKGYSRLLGSLYATGSLIGKDEKKAEYWLLREVGQSDFFGDRAVLANLYHFGSKAIKNDKKAHEWYKKAVAQHDDPVSHLNLGALYTLGKGTSKNLSMAKRHYEKAFNEILGLKNFYHEYPRWKVNTLIQKVFLYHSSDNVEPVALAAMIEKAESMLDQIPLKEQITYKYLFNFLKKAIVSSVVLKKATCDINFSLITDSSNKTIGQYFLLSIEAMQIFANKNLCMEVFNEEPGFMQCNTDSCDEILWEKISADLSKTDVVILASHRFGRREDNVLGHANGRYARIVTSNESKAMTIQHEILHLYKIQDEYRLRIGRYLCEQAGSYLNLDIVEKGKTSSKKEFLIEACDEFSKTDAFRLVEEDTIMGDSTFHIPQEYNNAILKFVDDSNYFDGKVARGIQAYFESK